MQKAFSDWTDDESDMMMEFEAYKQRKDEELAEKERQRKEESARKSCEYWAALRAQEDRERAEHENGSLGWFLQQASRNNRPRTAIRITNHADNTQQYLTQAYRLEVERRGGTMQADDYTQRAIVAVSRWATAHTKDGLLLRGYVGVGKTTMLYALATLFRVLEQREIRIIDARKLTALAKDNKPAFDELVKTKLLGIDDLGTEPLVVKSYGNETTPLMELLTERYDRRAFTIITTNLTIKTTADGQQVDEIQQTYGDRLADRFREMYNTIGYNAEQKSYRQ